MSRCGGGEGEVHDLRSHCHTSIFQGSHWLTRSSALIPSRSLMNVCCSWWQGPLMSSNCLCSFPALLEGLGIILLLLRSARSRESWQGRFWADLLRHRQGFFLRAPAAFMPWGWLPHWDYNLGNLGPGLPLGPTNASAVLTFPPSPSSTPPAQRNFL